MKETTLKLTQLDKMKCMSTVLSLIQIGPVVWALLIRTDGRHEETRCFQQFSSKCT